MGELQAVLQREFGVVSAPLLRASGFTSHGIQVLVRTGQLTRVRRGWYRSERADADAVEAVRRCGALSCISALSRYKVWTPTNQALHIRYVRRPEVCGSDVVHVLPREIGQGLVRSVDGPLRALACALTCVGRQDAVAVLDSARRVGLVLEEDLVELARVGGARTRSVIRLSQDDADSGVESHFRLLLVSLRLNYRTQVLIAGVGRVDFLIGDRLVVEVDGREYHSSTEQFRRDRARDVELQRLGFAVLRLTYRDVMFDRERIADVLRDLVRNRAHCWSGQNALWRKAGLPHPVVSRQ